MGQTVQSSFRRILLSRILLLSIPILLVGEYVVYRKVRSGVLETARFNLTESAVWKARNLQTMTAMLQSNLLASSKVFVAEGQQAATAQEFVERMDRWSPEAVQCVQIQNAQTQAILGSTCGSQAIATNFPQGWQQQPVTSPVDVLISPIPVPRLQSPEKPQETQQLKLNFSVPIYDANNTLRYILSTQALLQQQEFRNQASLQGYTIVINQDEVILAHVFGDRVGQPISQQPNAPVLRAVVRSAIAGQQESLHLFEENQAEWLAGYTAVNLPMMNGQEQTWVILAIAPIGTALYDLRGVQEVLVLLTLGLIGTSVLATIFIAREMAVPLEQLGTYALQLCDRATFSRAPKHFKIQELNQLAAALDVMIERLDERAEELETAWQEAQAANQLKSEFLATTSHELRTPLNAIIGSVRLVKDDCCDSWEESVEFLQQADDAAIHLLKIIDDLLDISKIESGNVELNLKPISIQELCQQCLRMVQPGAEKKQIALSMNVETDLAPLPLDERRVRQMLINLLSNAVKFTPEGGHVQLNARQGYGYELENENRPDRSPISPKTPYLCFEVVDSGIGIPKERWHLLFRPFQQVDSSSTRKHEGTGLGLALTKRLAELHGGTISFQSSPNQGSAFRLWLPALEVLSTAESQTSIA